MYQRIHETIRVAGVFEKSHFRPIWFDWRGRKMDIKEITLVSDFKQGGVKHKIYSVVVAGDVYRLVYDLKDQDWFVEAVWEGGYD
jgi:hypothetical protein